ncbi:MAG: hypothetical protein QOI91_269 [Solirubrobacteraceae bacterium]|nr:hypothetical protein [Solirubrobacteraceae bacterium]
MSITLEISGGGPVPQVVVPYQAGMNVQTLMEVAYNVNSGSPPPPLEIMLRFTVEYFGSTFGYELLTLNSTTAAGNTWWELVVNGAETPTGMDSTFLNDGDTVLWVLTEFSSEKHEGTRQAEIRKIRASN